MAVNILLLLTVAVLTTVGQVLVKLGASRIAVRRGWWRLFRSLWNLPLLAGAAAVLVAPLLYFSALKGIGLLYAYSFSALSYPLVLMGSRFILKEGLNRWHWAGILCICSALVVWNL